MADPNLSLGPDLFTCFLVTNNRFSLFADNFHLNGLGYDVLAELWHELLTGARLPSDPCNTMPRFILENLRDSTVAPFNKQNLIEVGDEYYTDQSFTISSIPSGLGLDNGIWIMTANADRNRTELNYLTFDVDRNVTVYIAYDDRATSLPNWMNSYTDENTQVGSSRSAHNFDLHSRNFTPGTITLGGNQAAGASGAGANYIVIIVEQ